MTEESWCHGVDGKNCGMALPLARPGAPRVAAQSCKLWKPSSFHFLDTDLSPFALLENTGVALGAVEAKCWKKADHEMILLGMHKIPLHRWARR